MKQGKVYGWQERGQGRGCKAGILEDSIPPNTSLQTLSGSGVIKEGQTSGTRW